MTNDELVNYIASHFDGKLTPLDSGVYCPLFEVKLADLVDIAGRLQSDDQLDFDFLCNLGGVDTGEQFEAVYSVASIEKKHRLDFKVILDRERPSIESLTKVWPGIDWYEQEIAELYGFAVNGNDNLGQFLWFGPAISGFRSEVPHNRRAYPE